MKQRIIYLLEQRLRKQLTEPEASELLHILQDSEYEPLVTDILGEMAMAMPPGAELDAVFLRKSVDEIMAVDRSGVVVGGGEAVVDGVARGGIARVVAGESGGAAGRVVAGWWRYAAVLILLVGVGWVIYYSNSRPSVKTAEVVPAVPVVDIAPGGNRALLTLSDGRIIGLDSAADGSLAQQGSSRIVKLKNGQLAYKELDGGRTADGGTLYNTISTPRGGQYQVMLPDGSKVWLNAASSLRFPTAFSGGSREVEVKGEAYFEIVKNAVQPFYVRTSGMEVAVLGTSFNVNAYADEKVVRTTLVEGSVRVKKRTEGRSGDNAQVMLKPGQQATLKEAGSMEVESRVDVEGVVAWKNGLIRLTSSDIPQLMRQLERWYDVEVEFAAGVPAGHITGEVPRNTSLLKVLQVLEVSGIHFHLEGRKIVITK